MNIMNELRNVYATDFWKAVRHVANEKIQTATNVDGSLDCLKLPKLLGNNPKVEKGEKEGYSTAILHLAPSFASAFNTCARASIGCGSGCLNIAGHGQLHMLHNGIHAVHIARVIRTILWFKHRDAFKAKIQKEIRAHVRKANREGLTPVVRPNGTSDLLFEKLFPDMFADNPDVIFYDYSKIAGRDVSHIPNYSLTFSLNESNLKEAVSELRRGMNVAAVFRIKPGNKIRKGAPLPDWYNMGGNIWPVIDADDTDLRFKDPQGVIAGLRSKGVAFTDQSGFVLDPIEAGPIMLAAE